MVGYQSRRRQRFSIHAILLTFWLITLALPPVLAYAYAQETRAVETLFKKMETAYAEVQDYQTQVEVIHFNSGGSLERENFLYTFKKPDRIRLDFETPHPGMILAYPDRQGKVIVWPFGKISNFRFHLDPTSRLLRDPSGQRIDQTEMGLLINHIEHSVTDQRRGPVDITEKDGIMKIRVMANDPFRRDKVTLYHFFIDQQVFLPVKIEESTPAGHLQRVITFKNLKLNTGISDGFFRLD